MPLYRFGVAEASTSEAQRAHLAREVVRIHCGVTGAPPSFVHAFFSEVPAAEMPEGKSVFVVASIRAGRSAEQKEKIASDLTRSLASTLEREPAEIGMVIADVPSSWNMEGGEVLPEPGEEAAWLARHGRQG